MTKGRLEAFSDGVIAIIITIMVLEMKVPVGNEWGALIPVIPVFLSYVLSFIFVGIYWNNHHHLLQATHHMNGRVLWANLHLLFWLSLIPYVTEWMGATHLSASPVALYGMVMLGAALAYFILTRALVGLHERDSALARAVGRDTKGKVSLFIQAAAIPLAFANAWVACGLYLVNALVWLIPDLRIEQALRS